MTKEFEQPHVIMEEKKNGQTSLGVGLGPLDHVVILVNPSIALCRAALRLKTGVWLMAIGCRNKYLLQKSAWNRQHNLLSFLFIYSFQRRARGTGTAELYRPNKLRRPGLLDPGLLPNVLS